MSEFKFHKPPKPKMECPKCRKRIYAEGGFCNFCGANIKKDIEEFQFEYEFAKWLLFALIFGFLIGGVVGSIAAALAVILIAIIFAAFR